MRSVGNFEEFQQVCAAIRAGHSVLVLGEYGSGKEEFAEDLQDELTDFKSVVVSYKGNIKTLYVEIAEGLRIPTSEAKYNKNGEEIGEKPLTTEAIKQMIASRVTNRSLLIINESQRLPSSFRFWLEEILATGIKLICLAVTNPQKDIFLNLIEIELSLPTDLEIRDVMEREAGRLGIKLSRSRLAELQTQAGRNPMLAKRVIQIEALGFKERKPEHSQYVVIMPIIIALLMSFGIIRFIGIGTGNKALYIFGGVSLVAGMTLRQLGKIRGARKRLGQ
jgi:hypothetical protein